MAGQEPREEDQDRLAEQLAKIHEGLIGKPQMPDDGEERRGEDAEFPDELRRAEEILNVIERVRCGPDTARESIALDSTTAEGRPPSR